MAVAPMQAASYSTGSYFQVYCENGAADIPIDFIFSYNHVNYRGSFSLNQRQYDEFIAPIAALEGEIREEYGVKYQSAIIHAAGRDISAEVGIYSRMDYINISMTKDDFHTLIMQDDHDYWGITPTGWSCSMDYPEFWFRP